MHGAKPCILIMDNFSVHNDLYNHIYRREFGLPKNIHIVFLPVKVTIHVQPCDLGVISSIKVGYKSQIIMKNLQVQEHHEDYLDGLNFNYKLERRVFKGIHIGGKETVYDETVLL